MTNCWIANTEKRPSFIDLSLTLNELLGEEEVRAQKLAAFLQKYGGGGGVVRERLCLKSHSGVSWCMSQNNNKLSRLTF